jgi:hypothetical protein
VVPQVCNNDRFCGGFNPTLAVGGNGWLSDGWRACGEFVGDSPLFFRKGSASGGCRTWRTWTFGPHIGMSVKEARERAISVKSYTVMMQDVDRAITDGQDDGFVKVYVRGDRGVKCRRRAAKSS